MERANMFSKLCPLIALFIAAGCAAKKPAVQSPAATAPITSEQRIAQDLTPQQAQEQIIEKVVQARDPIAIFRPQVNLTVYRLTVPMGTVSRNDEFWKRVDEQAVDVLAYDVLYKNGIRVGRAPLSELEQLTTVLGQTTVQAKPTIYAAAGAKNVELPMKRDVPSQVIYDFDAQNVMTVRSYEGSDNVFCLDFSPTPRRPGDVRVVLCPMVRTLRKRLVATGDIETMEIEYVSPERLFHLNLRTDIPLDQVLIVAPSPEASANMSLGHTFLVHEGNADKLEEVLIFVPQAIKPKQPTVEASAAKSN
jgi:hypothetical protein